MEIKRDVYLGKLIGRISSAMSFGFGDSMSIMEKVNQEQCSLFSIPDSFRKMIVVGGPRKARRDENGIITLGLRNFLLDADSLKS